MKIKFIQDIIDKIRNKNTDFAYKDNYKEAILKKNALEYCLKNIETLIIGSSHGQYDYIPDNKEFNLSMPSQDLYYSEKMYRRYECMLPKLKNIVLFISVFSSGFCLEKCSEYPRIIIYHDVFGIMPECKDLKLLYDKYSEAVLYIKKRFNKVSPDYRGINTDINWKHNCNIISDTAEKRAASHLKQHNRGEQQYKYLTNIINDIENKGYNLYLILAPAHSEYKSYLPPKDEIFKSIYDMANQSNNVKIIDCYSQNYCDDDFMDYDHLNISGAKKATEYIRSCIKE